MSDYKTAIPESASARLNVESEQIRGVNNKDLAELESKIEQETERATLAEMNITQRLKEKQDAVEDIDVIRMGAKKGEKAVTQQQYNAMNTKVDGEIKRAQKAEQQNATDIANEVTRAKNRENSLADSLSNNTASINTIESHIGTKIKTESAVLIRRPNGIHTSYFGLGDLPAQKYNFFLSILEDIDGDIKCSLVCEDDTVIDIGTLVAGELDLNTTINIEEDLKNVKLAIITPPAEKQTGVSAYWELVQEKTVVETINEETTRAIAAEENLQSNIDNKDFDILQRTTITLVDNQDANNRGKTPKVFKTGDVVKFELGEFYSLGNIRNKTFAIYVRVGDLQKEIGKLSVTSSSFTHIFTEDCYDNSIWCWSTDGEKTDVVLNITITQINSEIQDVINSNDNSVFEYIRQHKNGGEVFLKSIKPANTRFRVEWLECTDANPGRRNLLLHNSENGTYVNVAELGLHESIELTPDFPFDLIGLTRNGVGHLLRITWLDSPIARFIEEKAGNTKVVDLGNIGYIEDDGYLDNITEEGVYKGLGSYTVGSYERVTNFKLTVYKQYNAHGYAQICQLLTMFIPFSSVTIIKGRSFLDGEWTEWVYPNSFAWDEIGSSLTKYKMETNKRLKAIEALPIVTTEPIDEEVPDVPEYITRKDLDNAIAEAITNTINTPV